MCLLIIGDSSLVILQSLRVIINEHAGIPYSASICRRIAFNERRISVVHNGQAMDWMVLTDITPHRCSVLHIISPDHGVDSGLKAR